MESKNPVRYTIGSRGGVKWIIFGVKDAKKTITAFLTAKLERKLLKINVGSLDSASNLSFLKEFNRSIGQELLIRAFNWGIGKGATRIHLPEPGKGKHTFDRFVRLGILSDKGKILKVPKPLDLEAIQLGKKPKPHRLVAPKRLEKPKQTIRHILKRRLFK